MYDVWHVVRRQSANACESLARSGQGVGRWPQLPALDARNVRPRRLQILRELRLRQARGHSRFHQGRQEVELVTERVVRVAGVGACFPSATGPCSCSGFTSFGSVQRQSDFVRGSLLPLLGERSLCNRVAFVHRASRALLRVNGDARRGSDRSPLWKSVVHAPRPPRPVGCCGYRAADRNRAARGLRVCLSQSCPAPPRARNTSPH